VVDVGLERLDLVQSDSPPGLPVPQRIAQAKTPARPLGVPMGG
jgi:hypothetical protein